MLGGYGMPHKVESLSQRVAMVDAVVTEDPQFSGVQRRKHGHTCNDRVKTSRIEERLVGGVVSDDEQAGHNDPRECPKREQQQPVVGAEQASDDQEVHDEISPEQEQAARRRTFVAARWNHPQYRFEAGGLSLLTARGFGVWRGG